MNNFKGFSGFIPLGSMCRTAWQMKTILRACGKNQVSYPFDWTISPLDSVIKIIKNKTTVERILNPDETQICSHGQILCGHTGIRFAHDFHTKEICKKYNISFETNAHLPKSFFASSEVIQAKERFAHAHKNLRDHLAKENIFFIRFIDTNPSSAKDLYKEVYSGEAPLRLLSCLKKHGAHPTSRLIYIFSKTLPGIKEIIDRPVTRLEMSSRDFYSCNLYERKGHNGNQADTFYGDSHSWLRALKEAQAWFSSF